MFYAFALYDVTGAPVIGSAPSFASYYGSDGSNIASPVIYEIGGGLYGFDVPGADLQLGVAYEIATGVQPARLYGFASVQNFVAFALYDAAGFPLTGQIPVFDAYKEANGASRTPPALVELGGGLYAFTPTSEDALTGTAYLISAPGAHPSHVSGTVTVAPAEPSGVAPEISNFQPPADSPIGRQTALSFDVINAYARLEVAAFFESLNAREVVHDGDGFAPLYAGSSIVAITGGVRVTVVRAGGWPAGHKPSLRIRAYAADGTEGVIL